MPSADETARRALWLTQRDRRIANRRRLEIAFAGDPVAAASVHAGFAPLLNAALDAQLPPDLPDDIDSLVVVNHDLNL